MSAAERLYVIIDRGYPEQPWDEVRAATSAAAAAGARLFQLRLKGTSTRLKHDLGRRIVADLAGFAPKILVNDRLDLAKLLAADGVHAPSDGLPLDALRTLMPDGVFASSCHDEASLADAAGFDWATLSPVAPPTSKTDHRTPLGVDGFAALVAGATLPVFALGGVSPDDVEPLLDAGAAGVAVLGGIMGAEQPAAATSKYLAKLGVS